MEENQIPQCKDCVFFRGDRDDMMYDRCCIEPTIVYRGRDYPICNKFKPKMKS